MIHTNKWRPDTCGCEIEFQWDDSVSPDLRVHTPTQIVTKCPSHSVAVNEVALWSIINDENPRKNKLLAKASTLFPSILPTNPDGSVDFTKLSWSFDAQRVLNVSITGLTGNQRNTLQSAADTLFGAGKVKVV